MVACALIVLATIVYLCGLRSVEEKNDANNQISSPKIVTWGLSSNFCVTFNVSQKTQKAISIFVVVCLSISVLVGLIAFECCWQSEAIGPQPRPLVLRNLQRDLISGA